MSALPAALSVLAIAAWALLLDGDRTSRFRRIAEAAAAHFVTAVIVAVVFAALGAFRPLPAAAAAAALPAAVLVVRGRGRPASQGVPLATPLEAGALAIALAMLPVALPGLEPLRMVRDAGVYSTRALHHLREGRLDGRILARDRVRGELLAVFDRDNLLETNEASADEGTGGYLPGTYVSPTDRSRFRFQFLPGWPMALAVWGGHFGRERLFGAQPFLFVLSILLFAFAAERETRGQATPLAALLLLASGPLLLFFTRYPTAELLLMFSFLFVIRFAAERSRAAPVLGAAGVVLFALSHSSSFLYTPLLGLAAIQARRRGDRRLAGFAALSFGSLLALLPFSFVVSPDYMRYVYVYSFGFLPGGDPLRVGVALVVAFYLLGLAVALDVLRRTDVPTRRRTAGPRALAPAAMPAILLLIATWTAWSAYRLGWTDRFLESANVAAWARRAQYANTGWPALAHLGIVSMVMATAVVGLPLVLGVALARARLLVASSFRALLLAAVLLSLGIYTFLRIDVPFNYYASRYFLPVLVPSTLLLLALLPRRLRSDRALAAVVVLAGLAFNLRYDVALWREAPATTPFRFALEVAESLPAERVLFVHGGPLAHPTLAIPLASLNGNPVIRVASANGVPARDLVRRYCRELGLEEAFWIGPEPPRDGRPARRIRFEERESPEGILYPTALERQERTFYLSALPPAACAASDGDGTS
jgi:hypothetical protein